ncbi:MAG: IS1182 family transposase [Acidimicrobiia bacterium]|nr:IS1182 family transposase [Acidimicrobiia bacterium]
MLPIRLADQLQPRTFEYTVNYLVDNEIDLSVFESRYQNDETGAPAYDPAILLKIILFAYSRGITSSRRIAQACEENVVFMALSADTRPHFTTIADFISQMGEQIAGVFTDVLSVCYTEGLIGKQMFAVDGCKISSNCSKEWSGTKAELRKKALKIEKSVRQLVNKHREEDQSEGEPGQAEREQKAIENLSAKAKKVRGFLTDHEDRIGTQGKPVKSNITDNESAKMPSSHGVIQGYNGIATVDAKHQIIVDAQAFGDGHEAKHVGEVIDSIEKTFGRLDSELDIYNEVVLTADSGFHSEASTTEVLDREIDAYIADTHFRKRDPRFDNQQEHKAKTTDKRRTSKARKYFGATEFHFADDGNLICPAGKPMRWRTKTYTDANRGYTGRGYCGYVKNCRECPLRAKCIRGKKTTVRSVTIVDSAQTAAGRMIERFDTDRGRHYYSRRMGTVEPVFANIRGNLGLNRFSHRGRVKVDTQWKLFCLVHNIGKLAMHGDLR